MKQERIRELLNEFNAIGLRIIEIESEAQGHSTEFSESIQRAIVFVYEAYADLLRMYDNPSREEVMFVKVMLDARMDKAISELLELEEEYLEEVNEEIERRKKELSKRDIH